MGGPERPDEPRLAARLGVFDAVVIGLGSMLGAGIFSALAPAAGAAGVALLSALALAALVAWCNATSSARLAARYPRSGGTYVYGTERLGPFWGYLAGWGFVVGKTASCAAMALTAGNYLWPGQARVVAVAAVLALTAVNLTGLQRAAWLIRALVAVVLAVLAAVVVVGAGSEAADPSRVLDGWESSTPAGVLEAAGLLFFAFAGYARIATLGEEVRDPARTIPRAIGIGLGITLLVYAAVAWTTLVTLGPQQLAVSPDPLAQVAIAADARWLAPVVRIGAAVAAVGALQSLLLGVSRTTFAMARDRHFPRRLAGVRGGVPWTAELAVGIVVAVLVGLVDLRAAIGFSSFAVLIYYAVANASAWTLTRSEGRPPRLVPAVGLAGCLLLAGSVPFGSVVAGVAVLAVGALAYLVRRRPAGRG